MTETTLLVGSVRCTQDPENDRRWRYVPTTPRPERAPDGLPTAALIDLGTTSSLQVGAQLGLDADEVEALRDSLAREVRRPERDLEVSPLVVDVETVELRLDAGDGTDVRVLARSSSSGYPPYTAVLHAMVEGDVRRLVLDALAGGAATLEVAYVVTRVATPASTNTRFSHTFESSSVMSTTSSSTSRGGSSSTEQVMTTSAAEAHRRGGGTTSDQGDGEVVAADIASWFTPRGDRPIR